MLNCILNAMTLNDAMTTTLNNDVSALANDNEQAMQTDDSQSYFDKHRQQVLDVLDADTLNLLNHASLPEPLNAACHYAMTGKGKRVRPLLVANSFQTVTQQETVTQQAADKRQLNGETIYCDATLYRHTALNDMCRRAMLAVEFLHAYSLIHDDLPALDNDELRRGRPTCHIKFDEATALLAGDVLQTLAFEVLSADIDGFAPISCEDSTVLNRLFAPRARRMVSGQMLDIRAENQTVTQVELEAIHQDKTGALIEAAVLMGAACAHANVQQSTALGQFAAKIGLAFQVQDDILDVTASTETLGKPAGSDEALNKSTYVKLMGVDQATAYAQSLFVDAKLDISHIFDTHTPLQTLADWLWQRKK